MLKAIFSFASSVIIFIKTFLSKLFILNSFKINKKLLSILFSSQFISNLFFIKFNIYVYKEILLNSYNFLLYLIIFI